MVEVGGNARLIFVFIVHTCPGRHHDGSPDGKTFLEALKDLAADDLERSTFDRMC